MKRVRNLISFDLEFWYDSEFILEKEKAKEKNDLIIEGVNNVKKILDKHKVKATFFVTGKVAEEYPKVVKDLFEEGHEIASHGYSHVMLNKLGKEKFKEELELSKEIIKKAVGRNPVGFRAPSWSISKKEFWSYKILDNLGFEYSSSLFPVGMGLYGSSKFPVDSFKPFKDLEILEIPIKPFEIGDRRIPFAGGFYFRLFDKRWLRFFMQNMNEKQEKVNLYLHPWEFCRKIPYVETTIFGKVITYYGIKGNIEKLDYLLSRFNFGCFENYLSNQ